MIQLSQSDARVTWAALICTALIALLAGCGGTGSREAPVTLRNIQVISNPPGIAIYRPMQYGRSEFTLAGITPCTLDGVSTKVKIGAYKDNRILWMDLDPSVSQKLEFAFNETTTTLANRADILRIGDAKALREWDGIQVTSNPPGVEIYCAKKSEYLMGYVGVTPVAIDRPRSTCKVAAYKDNRVVWLEVNFGQTGPLHIEFNDSTTQVATKADLTKMGNEKALRHLEFEDDLAEGRRNAKETVKLTEAFKKSLGEAPDAKIRIQRIRSFLDRSYGLADTVLGTYESTWSGAIERSEPFSTAIALAKMHLSSRGVLNALTQMDSAIKEGFDTVKNPPEELKAAYSVLVDYYATFSEARALTENPTGSLLTFRQRKESLESSAKQKSGKLDILAR